MQSIELCVTGEDKLKKKTQPHTTELVIYFVSKHQQRTIAVRHHESGIRAAHHTVIRKPNGRSASSAHANIDMTIIHRLFFCMHLKLQASTSYPLERECMVLACVAAHCVQRIRVVSTVDSDRRWCMLTPGHSPPTHNPPAFLLPLEFNTTHCHTHTHTHCPSFHPSPPLRSSTHLVCGQCGGHLVKIFGLPVVQLAAQRSRGVVRRHRSHSSSKQLAATNVGNGSSDSRVFCKKGEACFEVAGPCPVLCDAQVPSTTVGAFCGA
jgi:hypothetical protein